jgi:hypothetical protein
MFQVTVGQYLGVSRFSKFFTLYFSMYRAVAWPVGEVNNILKIVDTTSGANLLSIGMSSAPYIEVTYGNTQVVQSASLFVNSYPMAWTSLSFMVTPAGFSIYSAQTGYSLTVPVPFVETYGRAYHMYVSYPGWTSSGGYVSSMQFQSKWWADAGMSNCSELYDQCFTLPYFRTRLCAAYHGTVCGAQPGAHDRGSLSTHRAAQRHAIRCPHDEPHSHRGGLHLLLRHQRLRSYVSE